jgi:hypothetical protein
MDIATEVFLELGAVDGFGSDLLREEPKLDVVTDKHWRSPYGCSRGVGTQEPKRQPPLK